jgi:predicted adenine nucleotide alpha hydrolase (AANH) superfamily ATPase
VKTPELLLLHVCCGPCAAGSLPRLAAEGFAPQGFFYNPNIHPVTELRSRLGACREYAASLGLPMTWRDEYGLVEFVRAVAGREQERCTYCYARRMRETAREAVRRGIGLFSTTLLYSIHQRHHLLRDIAEEAGREAGVAFLYLDLREEWSAGRERWRSTGLYSQAYCGCVYSEMERYLKATEPLPAHPGPARQLAGEGEG